MLDICEKVFEICRAERGRMFIEEDIIDSDVKMGFDFFLER